MLIIYLVITTVTTCNVCNKDTVKQSVAFDFRHEFFTMTVTCLVKSRWNKL